MITLHGAVVSSETFSRDLAGVTSIDVKSLTLGPHRVWHDEKLLCFDSDEILVSSCFVPIHVSSKTMLLDQSYAQVEQFFPTRFRSDGHSFSLDSDPIAMKGRYVVLGGPIDGVWYHWLCNWAPRLILLQHMRPEIFTDPDVRFAVHPLALQQPFRAVLDSFGIPEARIVALDPGRDYLIEHAILVSFLNQLRLFPDILKKMADHLLRKLDIRWRPTPDRKIFASRQKLAAPKRRIANFDEIEPLLQKDCGFKILSLGGHSARAQADFFHNANLVLGGHGSDLANIIFCRPRTKILVFENQLSVKHDRHVGLERLAEIFDLRYEYMIVPTMPRNQDDPLDDNWVNDDYLVDQLLLRDKLGSMGRDRSSR